MEITITSYGANLRKNNGCIEITESNGKVHSFPPHEVSALVLSAPCRLTSEIVSLCMENDIYITMTDRRGTPLWHIEPFEGAVLSQKQILCLREALIQEIHPEKDRILLLPVSEQSIKASVILGIDSGLNAFLGQKAFLLI